MSAKYFSTDLKYMAPDINIIIEMKIESSKLDQTIGVVPIIIDL